MEGRRPPALRLLDALWVAAGLLVPLVLLARGNWQIAGGDLVVFAGIVAVAIAGVNRPLEFSLGTGSRTMTFSPWSGAMILGALVLPAPLAMAVGYAFLADREYLVTPGKRLRPLESAGKLSLALGAGWVTADALGIGAGTHGPALLLGALAVALVVALAETASFALSTLLSGGRPMAAARAYLPIGAADVLVATVVVAVVAPFATVPWMTVAALAGVQVLAFAVSRLATSENLHRTKNEYLRDVFGRYVPSHVADSLAESGEEIKLGGEQREITVLFADIRGFTSWSETVPAEEVVAQLNVLLHGLSSAVMATDGTLDKYTGDGLMAFWGAPLEQPDHAERALTSAIDMLIRLDECNAQREADGFQPFAIGIGIHSGPAIVGNIGHEQRLDYTAIGDTVNTSARLEAATKEVGSVLLMSAATHAALPEPRRQLCLRVGSIKVKGKLQPVDVYAMRQDSPGELRDDWQLAEPANGTAAQSAASAS